MFQAAILLLAESAFAILCVPFSLYYHESSAPFIVSALLMLSCGSLLFFLSKRTVTHSPDTFGMVVRIFSLWVLLILSGSLPYLLDKGISSFTDVVFESASGFTTTGFTILKDPAILPVSLIVWRSLTQWMGGFLTLILLYTAFPVLNVGNYRNSPAGIFAGNQHVNGSLNKNVIHILEVYIAFTVAEAGILWANGTELYKSTCYALGTLSLSSFSPESGPGPDVTARLVMTLFMVLSGISYFAYVNFKPGFFRSLRYHSEVIFYFGLMIGYVLVFWMIGTITNDITATSGQFLYCIVSFITTTGYFTEGSLTWSAWLFILLFILPVIGCCSGTLCGGIKLFRFIIIFRYIGDAFRSLKPSSTDPVRGKFRTRTDPEQGNSVVTYFLVLLFLGFTGIMMLSTGGLSFTQSVILSVSSLTNFGIAADITGIPDSSKIAMSLLMLTGRLEIYPVIMLCMPFTYTKRWKYIKVKGS